MGGSPARCVHTMTWSSEPTSKRASTRHRMDVCLNGLVPNNIRTTQPALQHEHAKELRNAVPAGGEMEMRAGEDKAFVPPGIGGGRGRAPYTNAGMAAEKALKRRRDDAPLAVSINGEKEKRRKGSRHILSSLSHGFPSPLSRN